MYIYYKDVSFIMNNRWNFSKNSVYNLGYHLIWCPKYRRKILVDNVELRIKELLIQKAKDIDIIIESMEIMPDHIHIFVKTKPVHSPHWIVQQLKGYTSRIIREEFPKVKSRIPTLWTRSYYVESVGHISEKTIKKYIEEQKNK